jgi:magnesium chelatase subunit D
LPPIKVIKNNPFNIDPKGEFGVDDYTVQDIKDGGVPLEEREVGVIPCPFVQVPVNVMEGKL